MQAHFGIILALGVCAAACGGSADESLLTSSAALNCGRSTPCPTGTTPSSSTPTGGSGYRSETEHHSADAGAGEYEHGSGHGDSSGGSYEDSGSHDDYYEDSHGGRDEGSHHGGEYADAGACTGDDCPRERCDSSGPGNPCKDDYSAEAGEDRGSHSGRH